MQLMSLLLASTGPKERLQRVCSPLIKSQCTESSRSSLEITYMVIKGE